MQQKFLSNADPIRFSSAEGALQVSARTWLVHSAHHASVAMHLLCKGLATLSGDAEPRFACTQDLDRTLLVLWADDPAAIVNNDTLPFFSAFVQHIQIRVFHFPAEVSLCKCLRQ